MIHSHEHTETHGNYGPGNTKESDWLNNEY